MAEVIHVKRGGKVVRLPDLSSIKAGEQYRIGSSAYAGKWRTAAADAQPGARKGLWQVRPVGSNGKKNGYNGGYEG